MKKKNNKGFSLIELIIAIAILVILTGLLAPQFMRYMEKSREAKDMQALDTVYGAVQTALANEDAYKEILDPKVSASGLGEIVDKGMTLDAILALHTTSFAKELKATIGGPITWTSKAVVTANVAANESDAVFVAIDPTNWKVTVWIGTNAGVTAGKPEKAKVALGPDGIGDVTTNKTAGTTFYISK
ncbi:MAG: prepilin-type N-terminal cleavage/methylation domain-containing protein [Clostridium sp.]